MAAVATVGAMVAAAVTGTPDAMYASVQSVLAHHGFDLPVPAGTGWDARRPLRVAVNAVYAYTATAVSPPELAADDGGAMITCTATACRANEANFVAAGGTDADIFKDAVAALLSFYNSGTQFTPENTIDAADFSGLSDTSHACDTEADCAGLGADHTCCTKGTGAPGLCCVPAYLNQYDERVSPGIFWAFIACAGLVLLGFVVQLIRAYRKRK